MDGFRYNHTSVLTSATISDTNCWSGPTVSHFASSPTATMSLTKDLTIRTCEMHTAAEPVRMIVDGYPELKGNSIMEKRLYAINNYDHIRKFCMLEPRGHSDMYGVILAKPSHPEAHIGAIYMDTHTYATMCGHVTIAVAKYALDHGMVPEDQRKVPETQVNVEAPCGLVKTFVEYDGKKAGRVRFHSVPAFAFALGKSCRHRATLMVPTLACYAAVSGPYWAFIVTYRQISQSIDPARYKYRVVRSFWNLAGDSAALLPMRLSNFRATW